jgi:hypothetical protein
MRYLFILCAGLAVCAGKGADEREWGEIGKAEVMGWNEPAALPRGNERVVAAYAGKTWAKATNVTGYVRAEFEFDPADMAKKPGGYVELHLHGVKGMVNGNYNRDYPADGKVFTKGLLVLDPGTEASFGVLKVSSAKEKTPPLRCRLISTELTAVLRHPADGAEVFDNTPDFAWYCEDPLGVTLEVSSDPSFSGNAVFRRRRADAVPFIAWDRPLPPGIWHWRVTTGSGYTTPARTFRQKASLTADCDPPSLLCAPDCMATRAERYRFTVGRDAVRVSAMLDGVSLRVKQRSTAVEALPPKGGWPVGVSKLVLSARDAKGNVARAATWVSCAPGLPKVSWSGDGGNVDIGGKPFSLAAIYGVDRESDIDRVAALGFNCVHSYARDGGMGSGKDMRFLDALEARGMKTFVSVNREDVRRCVYSRIAEKVGRYLPRRSLLAWYLADEPETHDFRPVKPAVFRRYRDFVKALDPTRPGIVSHNIISCAAQRYSRCSDVHFSQAYRKTLGEVKSVMERHRKLFGEHRPDMKYSLIVNPRASRDAEEFAAQIGYAKSHGCGFVVYAWFEALRSADTMEKLSKGMSIAVGVKHNTAPGNR